MDYRRHILAALLFAASAQAADLPPGDYIVIVTSANLAAALTATKEVDLIGGEYAISVPLGPASNSVPTHWGCQWHLNGPMLALFNSKVYNRPQLQGRFFIWNAATNSFAQALGGLNLVIVPAP